MKTNIQRYITWLMGLVALSAAPLQAFYEPNLQRWLNPDPIGEEGGINLYQFVGNDPVNKIDPWGLLQEDGHFYAAFVVARANGHSVPDAFELAYYAQYPDEDLAYDAISAGKRLFFRASTNPAWDRAIQESLHSLHGGDALEARRRRRCLESAIAGSGPANWEKGLLIHALGDSFAHTLGANGLGSAYASPMGHLRHSTDPDIPSNRRHLFRSYIGSLSRALGGRATSEELDSISRRLTFSFITREQAFASARQLAIRYGYQSSYNPAGGERLHPGFPRLTSQQVQSVMDRIRTR